MDKIFRKLVKQTHPYLGIVMALTSKILVEVAMADFAALNDHAQSVTPFYPGI